MTINDLDGNVRFWPSQTFEMESSLYDQSKGSAQCEWCFVRSCALFVAKGISSSSARATDCGFVGIGQIRLLTITLTKWHSLSSCRQNRT